MLGTLLALFVACLSIIGLSQYVQLGGSPAISLLLVLLIALPSQFYVVIALKMTIPILYLVLMAGSLMSMVYNFRKLDPLTGRVSVNYGLVAVALPAAASGAIFSVSVGLCLGSGKKSAVRTRHRADVGHFVYLPVLRVL